MEREKEREKEKANRDEEGEAIFKCSRKFCELFFSRSLARKKFDNVNTSAHANCLPSSARSELRDGMATKIGSDFGCLVASEYLMKSKAQTCDG